MKKSWSSLAPQLSVLVFFLCLIAIPDAHSEEEIKPTIKDNWALYRIAEYRPNYFIYGKPDTKVQFSFLFPIAKNHPLFFGYTQQMFWDLGTKDSNPFSDINFNPELFYDLNFSELNQNVRIGYAHLSNGKEGLSSRSIDSIFFASKKPFEIDFFKFETALRLDLYLNPDDTNKDIVDYRGPVTLQIYFNRLAEKIFFSEEAFLDVSTGGKFSENFSKTSFRLSLRFKPFDNGTAPRIFVQYFNGYGENLSEYNIKKESYRIGISIGGQN